MGDPLPFSTSSSCLSQLSQFFSRARTCVSSVSSSSSFYALSCSSFLPTVKNLYTFLAGPESNGESVEQFALFWTREPPFLRLTVCPTTALVLPILPLSLAHFLRRTFAGVFPLSSRKKFFYNFRIVLFGPSRFFSRVQVVLPESVSPLHHQPLSLRPPARSSAFFYFLVFTSFNPSYAISRVPSLPPRSFSCLCCSDGGSVSSFGKLYPDPRLAQF